MVSCRKFWKAGPGGWNLSFASSQTGHPCFYRFPSMSEKGLWWKWGPVDIIKHPRLSKQGLPLKQFKGISACRQHHGGGLEGSLILLLWSYIQFACLGKLNYSRGWERSIGIKFKGRLHSDFSLFSAKQLNLACLTVMDGWETKNFIPFSKGCLFLCLNELKNDH